MRRRLVTYMDALFVGMILGLLFVAAYVKTGSRAAFTANASA